MRIWRGSDPVDWSVRRLVGRATPAMREASARIVREAPEEEARAAYDRAADRCLAREGLRVQRLRRNLARLVTHDDVDEALVAAVRAGFADRLDRVLGPARGPVRREGSVTGPTVVAVPHVSGRRRVAGALPEAWERFDPADDLARYDAEKHLTGGGVVLVDADHEDRDDYVSVELVGEVARLPAWPADLARRTGAGLVLLTGRRDADEVVLTAYPPVGDAQELADTLGEVLLARPGEWHLMHTLFEKDHLARA